MQRVRWEGDGEWGRGEKKRRTDDVNESAMTCGEREKRKGVFYIYGGMANPTVIVGGGEGYVRP